VPDLEQDVLESNEEHHVADLLCVELMALEPGAEHFHAKTTVLIENVTHHIEEEEHGVVSEGPRGVGAQAADRDR